MCDSRNRNPPFQDPQTALESYTSTEVAYGVAGTDMTGLAGSTACRREMRWRLAILSRCVVRHVESEVAVGERGRLPPATHRRVSGARRNSSISVGETTPTGSRRHDPQTWRSPSSRHTGPRRTGGGEVADYAKPDCLSR